MNLKNWYLICFLFIKIIGFSQTDSISNIPIKKYNPLDLIISKTVYNQDEPDGIEIIKLLKRYFNSSDTLTPTYIDWTDSSAINYAIPNYLIRSTLYYYDNNFYNRKRVVPNLIFIEKKENYWIAKVAFNDFKDGINQGLICIYNFGVKKQNNQFKLFNILDVAPLSKKTVDGITFYYEHNSKEVDDGMSKTIAFNKKMIKIFSGKVSFKYIDVPDQKKLANMVGFDFEVDMNIPTKTGAFTDVYDNIIYASSNHAYYYPHEIVHMYIGNNFRGTYHSWFDEGLATYLGNSLGFTLEEHLKKLNTYLKNHPEINLNNSLDYIRIDDYTNYQYTIGGLFCKMIYEKKGYDGIFKLLSAGNSDEDFYKAIEKYFFVKRENLNTYLRKEISKY